MAHFTFQIVPESYLIINISDLFFMCQNYWNMPIDMPKTIQATQNTEANCFSYFRS